MKKKSRMKQGVFTVAFMFAATFVFISGVSFAYLFTRERIASNESLFLIRGVLTAAGRQIPEEPEDLRSLYESSVEELKDRDGGILCYILKDSSTGEIEGYVFIENGPGLWGTIRAAVGMNADLGSLTGVEFLEHNETPGLGARIGEEWFTDQFKGKMGPFTTVPEGQPDESDEFDAITGATVTSNAVCDILNTAIEKAPAVVRGR